MPDSDTFDWVLIKKWKPEPIGAVGFLGNDIAVIVAFYDDRDADKDGKVSAAEWVASKLPLGKREGAAVLEVAMQARVEPDVLLRDQSIQTISANLFLDFASGLVKEGVWLTYFKPGVSMGAKGVAKVVTDGMVKQVVVKKGMEKAAEAAFKRAVGGY